MMCSNSKLDNVNINVYTRFGNMLSICPQDILSRNEYLTSIKCHNFVTKFQKMTGNNHKLDFVNINTHTKFGQNLSISSQDMGRKRKFCLSRVLILMMCYNPNLDLVYKIWLNSIYVF